MRKKEKRHCDSKICPESSGKKFLFFRLFALALPRGCPFGAPNLEWRIFFFFRKKTVVENVVEVKQQVEDVESIDEEIAENQHVRIEVTSASDSDSLHLPEGDDDSEPEVPSGPRPKRLSDLNLKEKTIPMPNASSFFCLGTNNPFRKACHKIGIDFLTKSWSMIHDSYPRQYKIQIYRIYNPDLRLLIK